MNTKQRHKDEQRFADLFSNSKKGELAILKFERIYVKTLTIALLRRLYKRGNLVGLRLHRVTMYFLRKEVRGIRGERSTLKYWVDRSISVLEENGCITVSGANISITQKGKAWLFEAEVKTQEPCTIHSRGYDYLHQLSAFWKAEMNLRTPCKVLRKVLYWANEAWKDSNPTENKSLP